MRLFKVIFMCVICVICVICVGVLPVSQADIYRQIDQNGGVVFTDKPIGSNFKLVMKTPRRGGSAYRVFKENRLKFMPLVRRSSKEYKVDSALILAVIHAESAYNPLAKSRAGAVGLMQLMPQTAKRFGVVDREDAGQNIQGGTQYLRLLLELFNYDLRLALAAYNAGESAVARFNNTIPPYPETQQYVSRVITYYQEYLSGNMYY